MLETIAVVSFVLAGVAGLCKLALWFTAGASETHVTCWSCGKPTEAVVWLHEHPHCRACHLKAKHQRALADRDVA